MTILKKSIIAELKELMPLSVLYSTRIKEAKTEIKKTLYRKKLTKNNYKIADLTAALEHINKTHAAAAKKDQKKTAETETSED